MKLHLHNWLKQRKQIFSKSLSDIVRELRLQWQGFKRLCHFCLIATIQITTDLPDACVGKCSLTVVSGAFPPWSRTNQL